MPSVPIKILSNGETKLLPLAMTDFFSVHPQMLSSLSHFRLDSYIPLGLLFYSLILVITLLASIRFAGAKEDPTNPLRCS